MYFRILPRKRAEAQQKWKWKTGGKIYGWKNKLNTGKEHKYVKNQEMKARNQAICMTYSFLNL